MEEGNNIQTTGDMALLTQESSMLTDYFHFRPAMMKATTPPPPAPVFSSPNTMNISISGQIPFSNPFNTGDRLQSSERINPPQHAHNSLSFPSFSLGGGIMGHGGGALNITRTSSGSIAESSFHPNDVLSGKGKTAYHHVGNRRFRSIVTSVIDDYCKAGSSRSNKAMVVNKVVQDVIGAGGRFLKKDEDSGRWFELEGREIKDKVSHAIRDAATLSERKNGKQQPQPPTLKTIDAGSRKEAASVALRKLVEEQQCGDGEKECHEDANISTITTTHDNSSGASSIIKDTTTIQEQNRQRQKDEDFINLINETLGPLGRDDTSMSWQQQQQQLLKQSDSENM